MPRRVTAVGMVLAALLALLAGGTGPVPRADAEVPELGGGPQIELVSQTPVAAE